MGKVNSPQTTDHRKKKTQDRLDDSCSLIVDRKNNLKMWKCGNGKRPQTIDDRPQEKKTQDSLDDSCSLIVERKII